VDVLALSLSLTLPLSGGQFTGDYSLDVSPVVAVNVPLGQWEKFAVALPGVVFRDPSEMDKVDRYGETHALAYQHELAHVEQQAALGPGFWVAYALTGGVPFEPGRRVTRYFEEVEVPDIGLPIRLPPVYRQQFSIEADLSQMWMPPADMRGRFPIFRIAREGNTARLQWMPGYPSITIGN
jgi:hypothetical protein